MKKLLAFLIMATTIFAACKEKNEPTCPTIDAEMVPIAVKDSLTVHYPGTMVETWYKVDAIGYCAKFSQAPNTVFVHFGTDGTFQEGEVLDANGKEQDNGNMPENHQHQDENTCECH